MLQYRRRAVLTRIASGLGVREGSALQRRVARDAYTYVALSLLWFLRLPLAQQSADRLVACDDNDTRACLTALAAALSSANGGEGAAERNTAIIATGHLGTTPHSGPLRLKPWRLLTTW